MAEGTEHRRLAAFFVVGAVLAQTALFEPVAAQPPDPAATGAASRYALVVHVEDPARLLQDAQVMKLAPEDGSIEELLQPIFDKLTLPAIPSIDATRPMTAAATREGLLEKRGWIVSLAVRDVESVLQVLEREALGHEIADGIHRFEGEPGTLFVRPDPPYLIFGRDGDAVARFDRKEMPESLDVPPGNVVVEFDVEPFAPLMIGALGALPAQVQARFAARGTQGPPGPSPELRGELVGLYAGVLSNLVENSSRLLLSTERLDPQLLLHVRLVPRAGSDLETLLLAQPAEFPRIARAIQADDAWMSSVAEIRLTPIVEQATLSFLGLHAALLQRVIASGPDNPFAGMRPPLQLQQRTLQCLRGDVAVAVVGGAQGMRTTTLVGVKSGAACQAVLQEYEEAHAARLGATAAPWSAPSEDAGGSIRGVSFVAAADPERAQPWDPGSVSMARVVDVLITVNGSGADDLLAEVVERQLGRKKAHGLGPGRFAPLEARGGMFLEVDVDRMAAAESGDEEEIPPVSKRGKYILGAWAERNRLAIDFVMPAADFEIPAFETDDDLWPPPKAAPSELEEEEDGEKGPSKSGVDGVTHPKLLHKIKPLYPEVLRQARLEGKIVLQAVITAEGAVVNPEVVSCDGRSLDEETPRTGLDPSSAFCTLFADAALEAVQQWRYEPALKDGQPVAVSFTVVVEFSLK